MEARRVLILCEQGLLWRGIQRLLDSDPRLTIVGMTDNLDHARALLQELKPDVLILDQAHFPFSVGLSQPQQLTDPPPMLVALGERDNRIRIHHIEGRTLSSPDELIKVLVT